MGGYTEKIIIMQNLPSQLLQHIILFNDAKQAFAMNRVSKILKSECGRETLWKAMLNTLHPDFPPNLALTHKPCSKAFLAGIGRDLARTYQTSYSLLYFT